MVAKNGYRNRGWDQCPTGPYSGMRERKALCGENFGCILGAYPRSPIRFWIVGKYSIWILVHKI